MDRKLTAHWQISLREYDDGTGKITFSHLDRGTRKLIPDTLAEFVQDNLHPYTPYELMMIACAERVAANLGYQSELPW